MRKILLLLLTSFLVGVAVFFSCRKSDYIPNKPPIAKTGPDQVISLPTNSVSLDGNNSGDPDGKISEWYWTKISGPASGTINGATTSVTSAKNLVKGFYQFELKVTDNGGLSARDTVQVTVIDPSHPNQSPVANAGGNVAVNLSCSIGTVVLDGSGSSDPDHDVISYLWTKISGGSPSTLSNSTSAKAKVENLAAGQYVFELKVTDNGGLSSRDTMILDVLGPEYDLSITINANFSFVDNYEYCYYTPCSYYDYTTIDAKFNFPPFGPFNFSTYEYADTAYASDDRVTNMSLYADAVGAAVDGTSSINFKKLIEKGGGAFSGTLKINQGSAQNCNSNIYTNLDPLTISGSLDTTAHTISISIKGKTYF